MRLSGKMKQRGLTPLFHFLEKPNEKMRLSEKRMGKLCRDKACLVSK